MYYTWHNVRVYPHTSTALGAPLLTPFRHEYSNEEDRERDDEREARGGQQGHYWVRHEAVSGVNASFLGAGRS